MAIISCDVAHNMLGDATTGPKLKRRLQGRATPTGPHLYCSYQLVSLMHQGGVIPPSGRGSCIRVGPSIRAGPCVWVGPVHGWYCCSAMFRKGQTNILNFCSHNHHRYICFLSGICRNKNITTVTKQTRPWQLASPAYILR